MPVEHNSGRERRDGREINRRIVRDSRYTGVDLE